MAREIDAHAAEILAGNELDVTSARLAGLAPPLIDRLRLDAAAIRRLSQAIREVAAQDDPVGELTETRVRPNGLRVARMRIPLGVVLMIYESRPGVTADAAALCLKSGNAVILRGGSEALQTNRAIETAIRHALRQSGAPVDAVQLVGTIAREAIDLLVQQDEHIDLVIPRGGEGLIRAVVEKSRIPVLMHYKGVCHIYIDDGADAATAAMIVQNAKVQRPAACNAVETVLVHKAAAKHVLPALAERLWAAGVELRGCERTRSILGQRVAQVTEEDWRTEYLDLVLAVGVVDSLEAAVAHIATYGSNHTEAIITRDLDRAQQFVSVVHSATVLVNASTRLADGGELGLGAEIGISTSKLHAFGPMGARELTTTKFVAFGNGQLRES